MQKITSLTPDQEKLMIIKRDEWVSRALSEDTSIAEDWKDQIDWLYTFCELEKPEIKIKVSSPVGIQLAANYIKALLSTANVSANVWDNVRDNVSANELEWFNTSNYGNFSDYGWLSFYDYFDAIAPALIPDEFRIYRQFLKSGFYDMIQLKGMCIVCERPKLITRNNQGLMHNTDGPCIQWNDGYEFYSINGRIVSPENFKAVRQNTLSVDTFFRIENQDERAAIIQMMTELNGASYVGDWMSDNLKSVDTYTHDRTKEYNPSAVGQNVGVYTLFRGEIEGVPVKYVRCYCPSTDRRFFLGVPPEIANAKDGIAHLCRIPASLKDKIKSISRQGERYSFTFDAVTTKKLEQDGCEDVDNLVSLTGDEYFKLLTYEY